MIHNDPPARTGAAPAAVPARPRRLRPANLLHTTALLATTAVLVITEIKVPPHKGD